MDSLRRLLCISALLVLLGTGGWWFTQGAHRGWSQNRVPIVQTDEITGIVYTTYEDRFVPGLDVLGLGGLAAAALFAATFFIRSTQPTRPPTSS